MTASTSSTLRPTTAGTLVAGFPRGRFSASPGTRVLSFSRASSTISPADALRGPGPLGAREGAGDVAAGCIERSARPLPVAGAGLDQAAQRLVCGAAPRAVLDGHLIARQADRAVDVADGTGPASSRTPYPTAEQAGPQVLRAPVAAALSSPPPDPLPGLAAALRGLTHEAARFPQLIIIYDQIPDRRRGRGFATGIHLNEALEWSKRPGPPQFALFNAADCRSSTPDLGLDLDNTVFALDASTIDLCLSVFPWAPFRSTKAAVKLHTLLDLRGPIPTFLHVSDGKWPMFTRSTASSPSLGPST